MLHLGATKLLLTSLGLIIPYTHPPNSLLSTALSSTTHPCSLKPPQYSENWRSQQASVPHLSHDLWKKRRFATFVTFDLQKSQFELISCKATQTLHQIGLYSNKKSYKLHQPHFFTSTIVTPGTNLFHKNPVSVSPSATPVLVIERSCLPPAPNINQPFTPITTFVRKRCTSSFVRKRWKKPPPTPDDNPTMSTWQTERACQQREKKAAEAALQQQMEQTRLKQLEEKKKRDAERKLEEELRKIAEAEQSKAEEAAPAEATVVSPTTQMEEEKVDPSINSHLMDMMQGGTVDDAPDDGEEQHSPAKSKQKKITLAEALAPKPTTKPTSKSAKASFNVHKHIDPRVIVEASIKLTGSAPVQDFIVNIQELLKNGQLVNKMFAFCPIDPDGTDKKIHEVSGIQTNMTILGAHFKISSNDKNPFEKQKQWKKPRWIRRSSEIPLCISCWQWLQTKTPRSPLTNHSRVAALWWYSTTGQGTSIF
jgi:hypothetical protein